MLSRLDVALKATKLLRVQQDEIVVGWQHVGLLEEWQVDYLTLEHPCPICMKVRDPKNKSNKLHTNNGKKPCNGRWYRAGKRIPVGPF